MTSIQTDKLPDCNFSLIQDKNLFCYGTDALLLAKFCLSPVNRIHDNDITVDLCTGNGIIPILLAAKTKSKIYGVELQKESYNLAVKNVELNNLQNQITIYNGDICEIEKFIPKNSATIVTANPPYMKSSSSGIKENKNNALNIARHEIKCRLSDVIKAASLLLNSTGTFFMIHRPERLSEIFSELKKSSLEPKRMQFIFPSINKAPTMVLIESKKNAKPGIINMPPYVMYP